jgi:hypothetical protein
MPQVRDGDAPPDESHEVNDMIETSRAPALVLASILFGTLSAAQAASPPQPKEIRSPAPTGSSEVNLHAGRDKLYMTWLTAKAETRHALQLAVLEQRKWSNPRTIAEGERFVANWADFPSAVELDDGSCAAHWLQKSGDGRYACDVMVARSKDASAWEAPLTPHRDATQTEHGFVSLVPDVGAGLCAVWLDGRMFDGKDEGDPAAEMQLRCAQFGPNGVASEAVLDGRVCDCCQTAAVRTKTGLLVAYRDRSLDEVRDIALVRRDAHGWTKPYALATDGWKIPGCPVNGPALDALEDDVVAAWFTMQGEKSVVRVAFSSDGGATFSAPQQIDQGQALGRVDVVLLPSRDALVTWMETTNAGEASILARRVGRNHLDEPFHVARTSAKRASGFPRVARLHDTLYFAWTDAGATSEVRLAKLELPKSWRK